MNGQPSGVDRLNKSPVVGRLNTVRYHPYAGSKEKKSVEDGRAQTSRAQPPKASEGGYFKELARHHTIAEEFEKKFVNDLGLDPEMMAEARRRELEHLEDLRQIILKEESRFWKQIEEVSGGSKEKKKSVEDGRAHARAQTKAPEGGYFKELARHHTVAEEFEKKFVKDLGLDPEMMAVARRHELEHLEDLRKMILKEESRYLNLEYWTYFTDDEFQDKSEWRKVGIDKTDLEEPVSCDEIDVKEPVLASCDEKTDLNEPVLVSCDNKTDLKGPVLVSCDNKNDLMD